MISLARLPLLLGLTIGSPALAFGPDDVRFELESMLDIDEAMRAEIRNAERLSDDAGNVEDLRSRKAAIDHASIVRLEEIVEVSGWPRVEDVGTAAAEGALRAVVNADVSHQERLLPVLQEQAQLFEVDAGVVAVIEDRVLVAQGRPQKFGSQYRESPDHGRSYHPIADCQSVDLRRESVGLEPLARDATRNSVAPYRCVDD